MSHNIYSTVQYSTDVARMSGLEPESSRNRNLLCRAAATETQYTFVHCTIFKEI